MSWQATTWAKKTRGHRGKAVKLVLMVLADYYEEEKGYAWPSQAQLAEDCEMPIRTVQYALQELIKAGFVTRLQKGNQFRPTHYGLNTQLVALTQPIAGASYSEPATENTQPIAPTGEPATSDKVNPQPDASEPATAVHSRNQEEPSEEPIREEEPDWYATLRTLPRFSRSLALCQKWLDSKGISEDHAETTATSLKSKWPGPTRSPYRDAWATFQTWVKRPPLSNNNTGGQHGSQRTGQGTPAVDEAFAKYG